jgi:hypothetical protein
VSLTSRTDVSCGQALSKSTPRIIAYNTIYHGIYSRAVQGPPLEVRCMLRVSARSGPEHVQPVKPWAESKSSTRLSSSAALRAARAAS